MTHELRILPKYFSKLRSGVKTFEIRRDDRDYRVGDKLIMREIYRQEYTGREVTRYVSYILRGHNAYGIKPGFCILGLKNKPIFYRNEDDDE